MRLVVQRVQKASVSVDDQIVGSVEKGAVVFLAIHAEDTTRQIPYLVEKLVHLRIFPDDQDKMNLSLVDIQGEILLISQFTLYADCSKGRRPSFIHAASPEKGKGLYEEFIQQLRQITPQVQTGIFGASMQVALVNDGPATFIVEGK